MSKLQDARLKLRGELEAPPALRKFGSGWISGVLGIVLGLAGFLLVLSLRAPGVLSLPETRGLHDNPWFRLALHGVLILAFLFSILSLVLRQGKAMGTFGASLTLLAVMLGGSHSTALVSDPAPMFFGVDFFVLNVLFTGVLFVPLERIYAQWRGQHIFRPEWREDLFYYLVSSLFVQVLTFLTFMPAKSMLAVLPLAGVRAWVLELPFVVQFAAIMFLTDVVQYWVHRLFHQIPVLWKFHAVHHSAQTMDWMAGARMHVFEVLSLRSATVIPMFVLGFSPNAMNSYIFLVYLYSTFVHSNLNWRFPWIEKFLVTPRFHHWHHGIEDEAVDVNFAIHFPLLDRMFGTYFLPTNKWPAGYGVQGHPVPSGYFSQFKYPFKKSEDSSSPAN